MKIIKSIGYNQDEIIRDILELHNGGLSIDLDPCYNVGGFYKSGLVKYPEYKSDIEPACPGVLKNDVRDLPYKSSSIKSVIFDPPFLVSGNGEGIMAERYGSFDSFEKLVTFYKDSLISLQRVLKHGGLLIFKCQDFVHARQQHWILPVVCSLARELNFAVRDLFILCAKSRINGDIKKQQHARKHHCYFVVLKCNKRKDKIAKALTLSEI